MHSADSAGRTICDADGDLGAELFDGLNALVDNNLVRAQEASDGEPRRTLLEAIREFAHERLEASEELTAARRRHAAYMLDLVEQADAGLRSADQRRWVERLRTAGL